VKPLAIVRRAAFAASVWLAAALAAAAQAPEARSFDVEHYGVTLEVDAEHQAVRGIERIVFVAAVGAPVTLALDACAATPSRTGAGR